MTEQFVDLLNFENYEILNKEPFTIRKKSNQKIISEWTNDRGYKCIDLVADDNKRHKFKKHRLIAEQFLPNPLNLPEIDHINHDRTDNRLENLRWVSRSNNLKNRKSAKGIEYIFVDEIDEDSITVTDYGAHEFEDYYFDETVNKFYFWNGIQFRELHINETNVGSKYVKMIDTEGKSINIFYSKFKKIYGLV